MTDLNDPTPPNDDPFAGADIENGIYLDHHATTPPDPRVQKAMSPFLGKRFGNPHVRNNARGKQARSYVEEARGKIAESIRADEAQIIFTSGATESNNMVLLGYPRFNGDKGRHIIVSGIEHRSVLGPATQLTEEGFEVSIAPVNKQGLVEASAVEALMRKDTILVSLMWVNNEVGTVQPVRKVATLCRERGIAFHTDASQALGREQLDPIACNVDFMSLSSHKANGPPGVGALFIAESEKPRLKPLIYGGEQERGLRPGTLPTALCVGFGQAARIAELERDSGNKDIVALRDLFLSQVSQVKDFFLNGHPTQRVPHNINFGFEGVHSDRLISMLPNLQLSTVSACSSGLSASSHVLSAMDVPKRQIACSVRIGLGRSTRREDVEQAARAIVEAVERIRARQRGN
jgi:cysteine desulfurase